MKIFNVIAILCSLFIVVNGQTAQEYTFTLRNSILEGNSNLGVGNTVELRIGLVTSTMSWDLDTQRFSTSLNLDPSSFQNEYYYYFVDGIHENMNENVGLHPCYTFLLDAGTGANNIYRKFDTGNFVSDDVYRELPCNVGTVRCGEFIYDHVFVGLQNPEHYDCRSIPVDKISTLKDKLAKSNEFNGNCEMST